MKKFYLFANSQHVCIFAVIPENKHKPVLKIHISGKPKGGRSIRDSLPHITYISRSSFETNYNYKGQYCHIQEIERPVFEKKLEETITWIKKQL